MAKSFSQDYINLFDRPTGEKISKGKTTGLAPLYEYVLDSSEHTRSVRLERVLTAFDPTVVEPKPFYGNVESALLNRGMDKLRILKLLNDIGLNVNDNNTAVIARLIEIAAANPDIDFDKLIDDFATLHGSTPLALSRLLERRLNIYDPVFVERVEKLTGSKPFTSADILCDLAVYARNRFGLGGGFIRA